MAAVLTCLVPAARPVRFSWLPPDKALEFLKSLHSLDREPLNSLFG